MGEEHLDPTFCVEQDALPEEPGALGLSLQLSGRCRGPTCCVPRFLCLQCSWGQLPRCPEPERQASRPLAATRSQGRRPSQRRPRGSQLQGPQGGRLHLLQHEHC